MDFFVGMDIVEISRFAEARHFERVAELVLSQNEQAAMRACPDQAQYLASRFAAKEAVIKALPESAHFQDFEILKDGLKPAVKGLNQSLSVYKISVSLTHSQIFAGACALVILP